MPAALPPGTFALHPYAEPPLRAGRYTLTGDVTGLPGRCRRMASRLDVVAPRFTLPPDQILGDVPAGGRAGRFDVAAAADRAAPPHAALGAVHRPRDAATAPTPWLALVLVAEGEGQLLSDVAVAQCVTPGVDLAGDVDVPKVVLPRGAPGGRRQRLPGPGGLPCSCHVREVDLTDTELAMGDDDGWLAVVLGNRLPQPGVRYLACLVNLEGQLGSLPTVPDADLRLEYVRAGAVLDLRAEAAAAYGPVVDLDTATMRLPGSGRRTVARQLSEGLRPLPVDTGESTFVASAAGPAARLGEDWSAAPPTRSAGAAYPEAAGKARKELADGWSIDLGVVTRPSLRFPVLAYWSFACEERGDFQYLAEHVHVRLLGHVPAGPETPDGDPVGPTTHRCPGWRRSPHRPGRCRW